MGMDFKSSDEPGDWRSTIRSSTTPDDRGGIKTIIIYYSFYILTINIIFLFQDLLGDGMVVFLIKTMKVNEIVALGEEVDVMLMMM